MDIPTVAAELNCEEGISMMNIDDSGVSNHCDAMDDNRLLEMASTTLMSDPPTGGNLKPLIGSSSADEINALPLATDQPDGPVPMMPKVLHAFFSFLKKHI
jgi:hypothetical protein